MSTMTLLTTCTCATLMFVLRVRVTGGSTTPEPARIDGSNTDSLTATYPGAHSKVQGTLVISGTAPDGSAHAHVGSTVASGDALPGQLVWISSAGSHPMSWQKHNISVLLWYGQD